MMAGVVSEFKKDSTMPTYTNEDYSVAKKVVDEKLPPILDFMGTNTFLVGNEPSYLDFYFFEAYCSHICYTKGELLT